jgi:hypothetical protein
MHEKRNLATTLICEKRISGIEAINNLLVP